MFIFMDEDAREKESTKPNKSMTKLEQKMKTLEKDFQNFKQSSSTTKKTLKICNSFDNSLQLASSPRDLMSALQEYPTTTTTTTTTTSSSGRRRRRRLSSFSYCSPSTITGSSGEVWRVRENELAIEDIIRERKLGFETGKLRGRRLFEEESDVSYEDEDVHSVCDEIHGDEVGKRRFGGFTSLVNGKMLIIVAFMALVFGVILMGRFYEHERVNKVVVIFPT